MNKKKIIQELNRNSSNPSASLLLSRKLLEFDNNSSRALYELGRSLNTLFRFKEARVALNKALKKDIPKDRISWIYFELGDMYKRKGNIKKAIYWYNKGLEESKHSASGYIYIGDCLLILGEIDTSVVYFKKAIKCKEGAIEEAYYNLAGYYRIKENLREAKKCYLKALQIDPKYKEAKLGLKEVSKALKYVT
ncbi:MAG: tetratricopeptide repeat protein [Ignavibacteriaceae bacterium]